MDYKTGITAAVIYYPLMESFKVQTSSTKILKRLQRYLAPRHRDFGTFARKMKSVSIYSKLNMRVQSYSKFQ
jgi:hypothetical protein